MKYSTSYDVKTKCFGTGSIIYLALKLWGLIPVEIKMQAHMCVQWPRHARARSGTGIHVCAVAHACTGMHVYMVAQAHMRAVAQTHVHGGTGTRGGT